jgi:serine protease Do
MVTNMRRSPSLFTALLLPVLLLAGASQARPLPDFTQLVEQNSAAVVNISTTQKRAAGQRPRLPRGLEIPDLPENSPFNEFFRRFFGEGEIEEFDSQSLGSGFLISTDGYVISNNHVIKNADEVVVRLADRREFTAEVVGTDERSDVALLKIDATDLPTVKLGTDHDLRVGEWVLAIGSPFGFDHTVTAGIVSAIGRSLPRENYVPFIQTDVAINPGNSGGPLFNLDGEVVGVNSQIFSRTGGFMGLSFAIPIDVAIDVAEQLRDKGSRAAGWACSSRMSPASWLSPSAWTSPRVRWSRRCWTTARPARPASRSATSCWSSTGRASTAPRICRRSSAAPASGPTSR